ncbi:MAG TPA: hypothetical protein VII73_08730 [Caulobacteraceae bacterium]
MTETYARDAEARGAPLGWPAVIAGAAVALAAAAMLNLLGAALGVGSPGPFDLAQGSARVFGSAAGLWAALASLIALFVGGFVASRLARFDGAYEGMLRGLAVWAVAFVAVAVIGGPMLARGAADLSDQLVTDAASATPDVNAPADTSAARPDGSMLRSDGVVVGPDGAPISPAAAAATPAAPVAVTPEKPPVTAATIALWGFLSMLLGAVGAVFGGRYGVRRHAWETRVAAREAAPVVTAPRL